MSKGRNSSISRKESKKTLPIFDFPSTSKYIERISKKVREFRKNNHLTIEEFAEMLDVSDKTVQRIEGGKNLDFSTIIKISIVLNKTIDEIIK